MSFSQLFELYRHLGPLRFCVFIAVLLGLTLGLTLLGWWLAEQAGWPEHYGFACHGRRCLIENLTHSPSLLARGSMAELALFAYIWLFAAVGLVAMITTLLIVARRWLRARRGRIRPLRRD